MGTQSSAQLSIDPSLSNRPPSLPYGDLSSGSTSRIRDGHHNKQKNLRTQEGNSLRLATSISILPGDVLLDIFDFYRKNQHVRAPVWKWHVLVHVCQRWRQIIFASPHRLKLQILCTTRKSVRKNLCIWPAFPIVLDFYASSHLTPYDEDNLMAALEHLDRICSVVLDGSGSQLGKMTTMMQKPFPVLTQLHVLSRDVHAPVLSAEFLGGSAPRLEEIHLDCISFPELPSLLLSASDLVILKLHNIPPTSYIEPGAIVACLNALPKLRLISIKFPWDALHLGSDLIGPPPATRIALPSLTSFTFQGGSEYLEVLIAQIDSHQLDRIRIIYLNHLVDVPVAQLSQFIGRTAHPPFRRAYVSIRNDGVTFTLHHQANYTCWNRCLVGTNVSFSVFDWQASHMAQVLSQFSTTLSNVVHLKLFLDKGPQLEGTDNGEWLHLLHRFSAMESLYVSWTLARHVALALEDITAEVATEVLPSLRWIFLAGQPTSSIEKFIAVRMLSGRPVTMIDSEMEYEKLVSRR